MKRIALKLLLAFLGVVCTLAACEFFLTLTGVSPHKENMSEWDRPARFYLLGSHYWTQDRPPAFRMAVIGDSFAVGASVQADDTYAARLERMLNVNTDASPAEVRLYARAGSSTFQQLSLLEQALATKPQVVILGVCLNDPENHAKPETLRQWREEMWPRAPSGWLAAVTRRSKIAGFIYSKLENVRANRGYIRYYERLYDKGYSGWIRFAYSLHLFNERCNEAGAHLLVVIFPLLTDDFRQGRYPFEPMHTAIREVMDSEHAACLDLLDSFRGKLAVRMQAIPYIDPHPSEIAHRIAAESILERLYALHWIDERQVPAENPHGAYFRENWQRTLERINSDSAGAELTP